MRPFSQFVAVAFIGLAWLPLASGCGGDPQGRQKISGIVTLKGRPLDQGTIEFHPMAEGQATFAGATIKDGRYEIARQQGLAPGKYRVVISSGQAGTVAEEAAPGESGPPTKDRIPEDWNVNSQKTVEVKKDEPNVFDFHIP
ncbi:MAG TPA: hypothetical protein VFA26_21935 [Gemmataceae bacterium]|nr:hypothetical protein [Gemmataceae bacterium]